MAKSEAIPTASTALAKRPRSRRNAAGNDQALIGRQIRELRRSRGESLAALSARLGRSVGNLSEIERGLSPVTVNLLQAIADALGVSISWFFSGSSTAPADEREVVVRKGNRRRLNFTGAGLSEELLSPSLDARFMLVETTFAAGSGTDGRHRIRRAEEAGVVVSGCLELEYDGRTYRLEAGDSFSLRGDGPHGCRNPGRTDAVVIWVISPPHY